MFETEFRIKNYRVRCYAQGTCTLSIETEKRFWIDLLRSNKPATKTDFSTVILASYYGKLECSDIMPIIKILVLLSASSI